MHDKARLKTAGAAAANQLKNEIQTKCIRTPAPRVAVVTWAPSQKQAQQLRSPSSHAALERASSSADVPNLVSPGSRCHRYGAEPKALKLRRRLPLGASTSSGCGCDRVLYPSSLPAAAHPNTVGQSTFFFLFSFHRADGVRESRTPSITSLEESRRPF